MALCDFRTEQLPDGRYHHVCPDCGKERVTAEPRWSTECKPKGPSLWSKLPRFTVDALRHVLGGLPTCDQAEIDRRLTICRACPFWQPRPNTDELGTCNKCGCIGARTRRFLNMLAWLDKHCPVEKW